MSENENTHQIDEMVQGYIDCILWTENDYLDTGPIPLYLKYSKQNIDSDTLQLIVKDCVKFLALAVHSAPEIVDKPGLKELGRDFWLSRNGHGAGFEDGNYSNEVGPKLFGLCKKFKPVSVYVGDDGLIYFE